MQSGSTRIIGAGSPILDILVKADDSFIEGKAGGGKGGSRMVSSAEFDAMLSASGPGRKIAPGGSSANTIFGLARLGLKTEFLGAVGADKDGDFYRARYEAMGGSAAKIRVKKDFPTGRCLCMISPDSQRTMRTDLGAAISMSPEEISPADFKGCTHMHMEGYLLFNKPLAMKMLAAAKSSGLCISLDLSSFEVVKAFGDIGSLLDEYVDIVFANEDEAAAFSGGGEPEAALDSLSKLCGIAAVKLGKDGALIKRGPELCRVPARKVKAVDSTGAGDMWAAGFLYGILNGRGLLESGGFGALLGAEVVQIFGADIPEERWKLIRQSCHVSP